ncbi:MAG: hypothetical protein ACOYME_07075 [Prochlorotrichaceae cyanobacterium]|jgi:hypothetical protein
MAPTIQQSQPNCKLSKTIADPLPQQPLPKDQRSHPIPSPIVIELTQGICAKTSIPLANHSALRSGFAGQPLNPRWTATKVVAWKTGREWRHALSVGTMVVRPSDSLLIPLEALNVPSEPETIAAKPHGFFYFLPLRLGMS